MLGKVRLIWTSDVANTLMGEDVGGQVVGLIIGVPSFSAIPDEFENALVDAILKHANASVEKTRHIKPC